MGVCRPVLLALLSLRTWESEAPGEAVRPGRAGLEWDGWGKRALRWPQGGKQEREEPGSLMPGAEIEIFLTLGWGSDLLLWKWLESQICWVCGRQRELPECPVRAGAFDSQKESCQPVQGFLSVWPLTSKYLGLWALLGDISLPILKISWERENLKKYPG